MLKCALFFIVESKIGSTCTDYKAGVSEMMNVVFSENEMLNCSTTGQRNRKGVEPKPTLPIDARKVTYSTVEHIFRLKYCAS